MSEHESEPSDATQNAVDAASIDKEPAEPAGSAAAAKRRPQYPFPRKTLEDAIRIPTTIRTHNGGEPYAPAEIARALNIGGRTGNFFYLTTASRDYGLSEGTRDAAVISLTALGKQLVYPTSNDDVTSAKMTAFLKVDLFRQMLEHYKGSKLPDDRFVRNTLETKFGLDPRTHDDFLDVWKKNCRYVGIGADWSPGSSPVPVPPAVVAIPSTPAAPHAAAPPAVVATPSTPVPPPVATAPQGESGEARPLVCFVAMPFSERSEEYAPGFFTEVFASLFKPAIEDAGFEAKTARSQGSDLIHSTIVNGLLDADLVLVDLTEHNPNVLFELGLRIAEGKPTVLVKAIGTNPIFDVDNLMRVQSYNPNLWPSTVKDDVPTLTAHIKGAWAAKGVERSYMDILRQTSS